MILPEFYEFVTVIMYLAFTVAAILMLPCIKLDSWRTLSRNRTFAQIVDIINIAFYILVVLLSLLLWLTVSEYMSLNEESLSYESIVLNVKFSTTFITTFTVVIIKYLYQVKMKKILATEENTRARESAEFREQQATTSFIDSVAADEIDPELEKSLKEKKLEAAELKSQANEWKNKYMKLSLETKNKSSTYNEQKKINANDLSLK